MWWKRLKRWGYAVRNWPCKSSIISIWPCLLLWCARRMQWVRGPTFLNDTVTLMLVVSASICSTRVHPRFHTCPSSPSMHHIKRCERFVSKGASTISMLVYQRAHTITGPSTHPIWKEHISRIATAKQLIFLHLHNLHMLNREVRSLRSAVYLSIIYIWRPTPAPNSSPSIACARGMVMAAPGLTGAFYLH